MKGYQLGIKIRTEDGKIITIRDEQLKEIGKFKQICDIQEFIDRYHSGEYDDETSLSLAKAVFECIEQKCLHESNPVFKMERIIHECDEGGFFPKISDKK